MILNAFHNQEMNVSLPSHTVSVDNTLDLAVLPKCSLQPKQFLLQESLFIEYDTVHHLSESQMPYLGASAAADLQGYFHLRML